MDITQKLELQFEMTLRRYGVTPSAIYMNTENILKCVRLINGFKNMVREEQNTGGKTMIKTIIKDGAEKEAFSRLPKHLQDSLVKHEVAVKEGRKTQVKTDLKITATVTDMDLTGII